jgi:hypothetical protein
LEIIEEQKAKDQKRLEEVRLYRFIKTVNFERQHKINCTKIPEDIRESVEKALMR